MGDFKSQIEEQKKVHLIVDQTNISPPSEKNVPLKASCPLRHILPNGENEMKTE